jgi:two-component system, NarL family, sensor kinase
MVAGHYPIVARGGHHGPMAAQAVPPLRGRRIAAYALLGLVVLEVAVAVLAGVASDLTWARALDLLVVSNCAIGLALALSGFPIARLRPRIPIGWALLAGGCSWALTGTGTTVLAWASSTGRIPTGLSSSGLGPDALGWNTLGTAASVGWVFGLSLGLPLALMLLPDGRLPSRRWTWLPGLAMAASAAWLLVVLIAPDQLSDEFGVPGLRLGENQRLAGVLAAVGGPAVLATYLGSLAALVVRYRRGSERIRTQLLWVLLAAFVVTTVFAVDPLLPESLLSILVIVLLPASIAIAVLRHRMLDIQVVVSRSVVSVLLTAGAVVTYLVLVTAFDRLWHREAGLGPPVIATVAIAAAFNPVRVWLRRGVERAVYGARSDPVRAIAAVGASLSDAGSAGPSGLGPMLETLCGVLRLPGAALVVDGATLARSGVLQGATYETPLPAFETTGDPEGARAARLVVALRPGEARIHAEDRGLLDLLASPVGVALHAAKLAEELSRSRQQVITAREEERRRLRRDLHDGLGPQLTSVVLNADAARRLIGTDPGRSAELLEALRDRTTAALDDIRRLVYDLRPPALDSLGLVGALEEYAAVISRRADGSPLRVDVELSSTSVDALSALSGLPAAVEVAAYRVATEALTNVTRHSDSEIAMVRVAVEPGALVVRVEDDGTNVGGGWQPGVGLTSIRERAAELGGSCTIRHDRTGGLVEVRLPLTPTAPVEPRTSARSRT